MYRHYEDPRIELRKQEEKNANRQRTNEDIQPIFQLERGSKDSRRSNQAASL